MLQTLGQQQLAKLSTGGRKVLAKPWTCEDCQIELWKERWRDHRSTQRRGFATSLRRPDEGTRKPIDPPTSTSTSTSPSPLTSTPAKASTDQDTLETPASQSSNLPSAIDKQRWHLSRRTSKLMDELLAKASLASQQINTYTGTDFSGIEALRSEIIAQEGKVKDSHQTVSEQKDRHVDAHAKQAASQKEIVSLLERKSSWGPTDLERYMNLVRSEHLDEQAVQAAKENLATAERDLEDARALLERLERKQYHEEQIWSDTIRRNSTWVTIGLMGVNILLLLAQIVVFEPYRRKKIVSQVKAALDEKSLPGEVAQETKALTPSVEEASAAVEQVIAEEPPAEQLLDKLASEKPAQVEVGTAPVAAGEVLPEETVEQATQSVLATSSHGTKPAEDWWEAYQAAFVDLFSERMVQLKKVEVTTVALQGAATGVAAMGMLFLLLRPK